MGCMGRVLSSSIFSQYSLLPMPRLVGTKKPNSMCMISMAMPLHHHAAALSIPLIRHDDSLPMYLHRSSPVTPSKPLVDETTKTMELQESVTRALRTISTQKSKMKLIDTIQRLGIAYHFEEQINILLKNLERDHQPDDEDLFTTALRFRLLRQNGHHVTPDIFLKFMNSDGEFKESLHEDTFGLLGLYEASYLGANGEDILTHAMEYTKTQLNKTISKMAPQLYTQVLSSLELPRHMRMDRLEARRYIEEYSTEIDHNSTLLELAKLNYNQVQSLHRMELDEISRWWKDLGLVDKLTFARDRPLECFLWTVGILPDPKFSGCRIELAKTIAILLVIDDIYDTYGAFDDLVLFTKAIQRWDLDAMEHLPEYMKICYMALYNTTNEISYKILKEHGCNVIPFLRKTWIDMIEGFMVEAEWVNYGHAPNLEEYLENGVTTAGSYMALVHIFFLIGQGVTDNNIRLLIDPYPKLFSSSGQILRLWDDLGTAKEEEERGDVASSIQLYTREKGITSDEEGRNHILERIRDLWKELNGELIASSDNSLPLPIIKACLNMARTSQVVYQHEEDSYLSSVDNYVEALFYTPISNKLNTTQII